MAYAELGLLPGALAGFNYGNGLRFSQTVNARNLPNRRSDQQGTIKRLDYTYRYDQNANLLEQLDLVGDPLEYRNDYRQLGYDGLDRMTIANSANQPGQRTPAPWVFGWGPGSYQYDALDNLRRAVIGPLDFSYTLDSQGRANQMFAVGFDGVFRHYAFNARGQVTERDHNHAPQFLTWDSGQRLLSHSGGGVTENYAYDAHSHRVKTTSTGPTGSETRWQVYSRSGQMLYQQSSRGPSTKYYHLAGRLIAEVEDNVARYQHTDLIGSPRYVTDVLGQSITAKERVLAPYGSPMTGDYRNGPGFTGHMEDGATGLTYMQARYYDPTAMRFLSPDPVGVDTSTGSNFNRYNYANNNPYRFTDPDGRAPEGCGDGSCDTVELDTVVVRPSEEDRQRISDEEYLAARNQDALDFFRLVGGPAGGGFADSVDFRDNPTPLNAMILTVDLATLGTGSAVRGAAQVSDAFTYTFSKYLGAISKNGLRQGSYATRSGTLSPLQAQIELALPTNRGLPDALVRIDLAGLRAAGYEIPGLTRVSGRFGLPGGGYEILFPYRVPPQFLTVVP